MLSHNFPSLACSPALSGLTKSRKITRLTFPRAPFCTQMRWRSYSICRLGIHILLKHKTQPFSVPKFSISCTQNILHLLITKASKEKNKLISAVKVCDDLTGQPAADAGTANTAGDAESPRPSVSRGGSSDSTARAHSHACSLHRRRTATAEAYAATEWRHV